MRKSEASGRVKLEGRYVNYFEVGYTAYEVVIDCGQLHEDWQQANFHTRLVTNPIYAQGLLETLRVAIEQYEDSFGTICEKE